MTHPCQSDRDLEQGLVTIRALRSLTTDQADLVSKAVAALPGEWTVEHHDDYDGYLLIMISPNNSSTEGAAFLISGEVDEIDVAELHHEELRHLGCFSTIEAATAELTDAMQR